MIARWGRRFVWPFAGLLVVGAVVLAVVAVDLLRTPGEIEVDDARFESAPMRQGGLWSLGALPGDLNERMLGLRDDLVYRRTVAMYLKVEPDEVPFEGVPELEALRAKTQFELTRLSREEPDPKRRSRILNLQGVMILDTSLPDEESRQDQLRRAVSAFRNAIELDPDNSEAKTNLEAVLSREGAIRLPSDAPTRGRAEGKVSGQGGTGSGY